MSERISKIEVIYNKIYDFNEKHSLTGTFGTLVAAAGLGLVIIFGRPTVDKSKNCYDTVPARNAALYTIGDSYFGNLDISEENQYQISAGSKILKLTSRESEDGGKILSLPGVNDYRKVIVNKDGALLSYSCMQSEYRDFYAKSSIDPVDRAFVDSAKH